MTVSLQFPFDVEDGWPPVGSESLPFDRLSIGYKCLSPPLFVKNLSVGDIIEIKEDDVGFISHWSHLHKSDHSTIWLLRLKNSPPIEAALQALRALRCNTTGVDSFGCYAIDVPQSLSLSSVDIVLDELDPESVAIAFPSIRHAE